jgi:hypothetical protein
MCCYSTFATIRGRRSQIFDLVVTSNEIWLHYFTPESKRADSSGNTHSPPPKKVKTIFSTGMVIANVFWDSKGVLHLDLLAGQKTINVQNNSTVLNEKVKPAIHSKRRKRQDSVCFLQDDARPHTATLMMATLLKLKWDVLPHPVYSPLLAPSDYHLFGPMKGYLGGKRFENNGEVIAGVQHWIQEPLKTFFEIGITKLPGSWHKCITVNGDYFEK